MPRGINLVDEATIQGRLWSPAQFPASTLAVWLDASDIATIKGATGVSQWIDKSGNNRHVSQTEPTVQPAYNAAGLNGKAVLSFDGNDLLRGAQFSFDHSVGSAFVVGNMFDANSYEAFYRLLAGSTPTARMRRVASTNILEAIPGGNANVLNNSNYNIVSHQWVANGQALVFANGSQSASQLIGEQIGVNASTQLDIGGTSTFLFGTMGEFILLSSSIDTVNRVKLEGYLAWKWGISRLPASHTFTNRPPLVGD
jgi:hypothetical protein